MFLRRRFCRILGESLAILFFVPTHSQAYRGAEDPKSCLEAQVSASGDISEVSDWNPCQRMQGSLGIAGALKHAENNTKNLHNLDVPKRESFPTSAAMANKQQHRVQASLSPLGYTGAFKQAENTRKIVEHLNDLNKQEVRSAPRGPTEKKTAVNETYKMQAAVSENHTSNAGNVEVLYNFHKQEDWNELHKQDHINAEGDVVAPHHNFAEIAGNVLHSKVFEKQTQHVYSGIEVREEFKIILLCLILIVVVVVALYWEEFDTGGQ